MADYKGSWLKGFASTFDPVGAINLGLQWKEKKAAQKKIDDAVEQFKIDSMELATRFDKARADGTITPQEYGDAMAWAIPLGKEMIGRVNDLYTNYQSMTPDQLKTELENIDAMFKFSKELDFTNLEQMKEFGSKLTQPDAKMQWNLVIKSIEGREKPEKPEVYKTVAEFQAKYGIETPYTFNATAGGYIPKFKEPETKKPDLTGAITYLKKFPNPTPEQFNSLRTGAEKYFNVNLSNVTQESLWAPEKPTPEPKGRAISLPLQENYMQKALDANTLEDKKKVVDTYEKAGYDTSEMPTDQEWIDGKIGELDSHIEMLKEITDEEGKLLGSKSFKFMSGDEAVSQTGEQWYKDIYEAYMFYLEELRKMGIDVSKYTKIKSPEEVSKVGFIKGAFTPGIERGYPSIYY